MFPRGYYYTDDNATDLLTRGLTPNQLHSSTLWSHGPLWFQLQPDWSKCSPNSVLHIQTGEEVESIHQATVISTDPKPGLSQIMDTTRHNKTPLNYSICVILHNQYQTHNIKAIWTTNYS